MALLITDPIDILLDSTGDIDLTAGDLQFSRGLPGVAQGCRIAVQLFRGEWFVDLDAGVPWMPNDTVSTEQAILGQRFNETKARVAIRDALLAVPGVLGLAQLLIAFDTSTRAMSVTWRARTVFGDTEPDTLEQT